MTQTSTPDIKTNTDSAHAECAMEGLSEDDEQFYASIQNGLKNLIKQPSSASIEVILKHSKSL
jgi:hypothetical protein